MIMPVPLGVVPVGHAGTPWPQGVLVGGQLAPPAPHVSGPTGSPAGGNAADDGRACMLCVTHPHHTIAGRSCGRLGCCIPHRPRRSITSARHQSSPGAAGAWVAMPEGSTWHINTRGHRATCETWQRLTRSASCLPQPLSGTPLSDGPSLCEPSSGAGQGLR